MALNDLVAGKIKGIYGQGAESPNFNPGDWFSNLGNIPEPIENSQCSFVGKVTIDLKNVSNSNIDLSTVEGSTSVNYNATTNYEDTGIFKGIDNFSVIKGVIKPTELTYGNSHQLNLNVGEGSKLDLSTKNALPDNKLKVCDFVGGGTMILPKDPNSFKISGTLDSNKKTILEPANSNQGFSLSNNMKYVDFANAESAFAFPASYGDRKLVKKHDGWYSNDAIHIYYEANDFNMGNVNPQVDLFESTKKPSPVTATAKPGYKFLYWGNMDNTKKYSTSATFTPTKNPDGTYEIEYWAYFEKVDTPVPPPVVQPLTITAKNNNLKVIPGTTLESAFKKAVVTAKGTDGSNLTKNIKLESDGGYNPNTPGFYTATYYVEEKGKKARVELKIQVTNFPDKPVPLSSIVLTGESPRTSSNFTLELKKNEQDAPNPNKATKQTIKGAGDLDFGKLVFTKTGTFTYDLSQVNSKKSGYTYDQGKYTIKYVVTDKNGYLSVNPSVTKADKSYDISKKLLFINKYTRPNVPKPQDKPNKPSEPSKPNVKTEKGTKWVKVIGL